MIGVFENGHKRMEIFSALGEIAFAAHPVDESLAFAEFAQMLWIIEVVDDVRDLMQHRPSDIEGGSRLAVAVYVREAREVNR